MADSKQVAHVSFSPRGGAGAVADRVIAAQRDLGWQADLVSLVSQPSPQWMWRNPRLALVALTDYFLVRRNRQAAFFSLFRNFHNRRAGRDLAHRTGILHLHWLPGFLWPPALLAQPLRARKVVWSVQDMWPFTGGCHYANECRAFEAACDRCPQVRNPFRRRVAQALKRKREGMREGRDRLAVAPSEWARSLIRASSAMRHWPTAVVPNPVDTRTFVPLDRAAARARWGFPADAFVVGVGAADLSDERKQVARTLAILRDAATDGAHGGRPLQALVFGRGPRMTGWPPAFRFTGPSRNSAMLAEWYNAMDVYVSLARYETFGNTLAEAAACATPSVCLTGSGMAEVVVAGRTGRHVKTPAALPAALSDWRRDANAARRTGLAAREYAVRHFDVHTVARAFLALYEAGSHHRTADERGAICRP